MERNECEMGRKDLVENETSARSNPESLSIDISEAERKTLAGFYS